MDKLNKLLQGWVERQKPDETKLRLLTENICQEVRRSERESSRKIFKPKGIPFFWLRVSYASLGVVAACLLMIILQKQLFVPVSVAHEPAMEPGQLTKMAAISKKDIGNNLKVLREVNNVFPKDLRWVQTSSAEMNLGIVSQPGEGKISSDCVMVRLVIFKREAREMWQKIWTTEVTAALEEFVQVPLDGKSDNSISFWAHLLPDGLIAIESDIRLKLPVELSTSFSGVLKPGIPQKVLSLNTGDVEYCIFEAASYIQFSSSRGI
jgi:hypothetical protein